MSGFNLCGVIHHLYCYLFPFILLCFSPAVDDLKVNTEYIGYSAASPVIQWFWDVVKAFSKEDMARLLQFVTGTSKVKCCFILNFDAF